jgi:hypothetical protein
MLSTKFELKYYSSVGFAADQGGRGFQHPSGFAIRPSDENIFVASRSVALPSAPPGLSETAGVQMLSKDFEFLGKVSSAGTGESHVTAPSALAFDSEDNLYVADEYLDRISVFDPEGNFLRSWGIKGNLNGQFDNPSGLMIVEDVVFVVDTMNHRVQKYDIDGTYIGGWGSKGIDKGKLKYPWGISEGNNDDLYVADWGNDRIERFSMNGEYISSFTGNDSEIPINRPAGVTISTDGDMYVADWGNQLLQVFDQKGKLLARNRGEADLGSWALEYFEAQQDEKNARSSYVPVFKTDTEDVREISARIESFFWDPCAVILDREEKVYVLETCRHRFQIFDTEHINRNI